MTDEFSDIISDISAAHVEAVGGNSEQTTHAPIVEADCTGAAFDPVRHAVNRDTGKPSKTKSGKFRAKRGGPSKINTPENEIGGAEICAGVLAANLFVNMGMLIFGEEWRPENTGEVAALEGAWADYLDEKGIDDLPAGLTLAIIMGGYAAKRLTRPKTSSKLIYGVGWIRGKFSKNGTRNHSGAERVRQNDASETTNKKRSWFWRSGSSS